MELLKFWMFCIFFLLTIYFSIQFVLISNKFLHKKEIKKIEKKDVLLAKKFPKIKILLHSTNGYFIDNYENIQKNFDSTFMDNYFKVFVFVDKFLNKEPKRKEKKLLQKDNRLKVIKYDSISNDIVHSKVRKLTLK